MNYCVMLPRWRMHICNAGWQTNRIFCMRDQYWQSLLLGAADYSPWLRDQGSLTRRIQQHCDVFSVQPQRSGLARVAYDEAALLGFSPDCYAFSREVYLCADGCPVVFAH